MAFFSILIPSYNRPEFISHTVQSVIENNYDDFEIIISDDNSPRQSEIVNVLDPFLKDSRIKLHLQKMNLGEPANRDFLLKAATGDWHIILCDDDRLYPNTLSTLSNYISGRNSASVYAFGYTIIDEKDRIHYSRKAPFALKVSLANSRLVRELLISDMFPFWMYHPATFCARKDIQRKIKSNREVGIGDDLMFLIDFINSGETLQIVPEILLYYRKFSLENYYVQGNQSAGDLPQLQSRALILRNLENRSDLHPILASLVQKTSFRKRLLYDPILWSRENLELIIGSLHLAKEYKNEMLEYASKRPRNLFRKWLLLRRIAVFVSLFGFSGLKELFNIRYNIFKNAIRKFQSNETAHS